MYQKIGSSGFFITSIAIAIAILFLFDYSPLFAANFSDKSSNSSAAGTDNGNSFRKSLTAAFQTAIVDTGAPQALEARNQGGLDFPSSLTLVDDIVYDDDRQARDRVQLWANPSTLEREKLNRTESGVPIQVEDPLATKREPKWHNACLKRSVLNDTLIKIIIGMQSPHPTLAIEEDRKASGTFIKMENGRPTILATSQRKKLLYPVRPKRGVKKAGVTLSMLEHQQELNQTELEQNQQKLGQQLASGVGVDDDYNENNGDANGAGNNSFTSVLEQKLGRGHQAAPNKKEPLQPMGSQSSFRQPKNSVYLTSTEISERHTSSRHIMKRSKEVSSRSRNYQDGLASSGNSKNSPTNQALAAVLGRIGANATHQLAKVMDKIFVSDVRITWSINCALNNARSAKRLLSSLIRVIGAEIENNNKSTKPEEGRIQQLVDNRREWLANFTDLVVKNEQPAARVVETRNLFANVSHYLQFVAVALEQMLYEQAVWDRQLSISYNDLERATLKMLCEIDTLCQLLQSLKEGKEELVRLMEINKLTDENLHAFESMRKINASSVESIGKRIFYSKDLLDSVYFNWLAKHKPNVLQQQQLLLQVESTSKQQQNDTNGTNNNSALSPATKANATWLSSTNNLVTPSMIRIGRYVMPNRERNLKTYSERLVRDKSMFENYEKVLNFYVNILTNVFV